MRVVILVSSLELGGAERVAATLANAWSARGDRVTLIPTYSGGGRSFYPLQSGVKLLFLADAAGTRSGAWFAYPIRLWALRHLLRSARPDAVVTFLPNVNIMAILASAFLRAPVLIGEGRDPGSQPCPPLLELLCRTFYRFSDMLTVQTENAARAALRLYGGPRRIRTIANPLPAEVASSPPPAFRGDRKILLSLGRISPEKQVDRIVDAFAAIAARHPDWDLHIYGDGPAASMVARRISELGLSNRAILKGRTADPWRVMANADAFVMASKFEGMPNALLEAMGIGLPCVAFDCPSGPRELSQDGQFALLVPMNDMDRLIAALQSLASDKGARLRLGQNARASILQRYLLPEILNHWDALFREVGALST